MVPLALAASVVVFFGADLFMTWLAPTETVAPLARGYMRARSFGVAGIVLAVALSSFFRGIGDARTPSVITVITNALNLFLDLGLVYGWFGFPRLGVVGAGIATAAAEWCYARVMVDFFLRAPIRRAFGTRFTRPDSASVVRLWRVGLPIAGEWVTETAALALFTTFVARMGDAAMAASHTYIQILSLSFMQAEGLSMAASTLVGRYIGAGELALVRKSFRLSVLLGSALAAFIALLFLAIPEVLTGLFTNDAAVLLYAGPLLMGGAAYQYCDAMAIVTDGALPGARDTRWPFQVRSALAWFVMLPLAWYVAFPLGGGLAGRGSGASSRWRCSRVC